MYNPKNGKETKGESFVYDKFKSLLPEDYFVFHNQILRGEETECEVDFIAIHSTFGVWVIEVKDWAIGQMKVIDNDKIELKKRGLLGLLKTKIERHPLKQARDDLIYLKVSSQKYNNLLHKEGSHKGNLLFPINSFAIFTNISREEIEKSNYSVFFPPNRIWTRDFLENPYLQEDQFERALHDSRVLKFQCNLDNGQINSIKRSIGVAEVVPIIPSLSTVDSEKDSEDIGTLDEYQNRLVRHKIESQIAIEGPAGSGKSIVLLQRAIHIHKEFPEWRICVVCFNALMANYLRTMLSHEREAAALFSAIYVCDIYDWVKMVGLKSKKVSWLKDEGLLKKALDNAGWNLDVRYDALLVDEGQDANDTLLELYRAMLLPDKCSFTFFYDVRQILYEDSVVNKLKEYGFDVEEKNLVMQQRSFMVILALAFYLCIHDHENPEQAIRSSINVAEKWFVKYFRWGSEKVKKAFASVRKIIQIGIDKFTKQPEIIDLCDELSDICEIICCLNSYELVDAIVHRITSALESMEFRYGDIMILLPDHHYAPGMPDGFDDRLRSLLTDKCREMKIPYTYIDFDNGHVFDGVETPWCDDNRRTADLRSDTVKLMTIHTAKGFDSKLVLIAGFDGIEKSEFKAQLGYVAITRAKKRCEVYYCSQNECVSTLKELLSLLKQQKLELTS
jgi:hypothetical protein